MVSFTLINDVRQGRYVIPGACSSVSLSVCLFVCLLATLRKKTTERTFTKLLPHNEFLEGFFNIAN